jgi:hypothetical protein
MVLRLWINPQGCGFGYRLQADLKLFFGLLQRAFALNQGL